MEGCGVRKNWQECWRFLNLAKRLITDVVDFAVESHEAGIVVDFEEIPTKSQPEFQLFISELAPVAAWGRIEIDGGIARTGR